MPIIVDKLEELGYDANTEPGSLTRPDDGKSSIIIELSTQISEQEYRISALEGQLEEKELQLAKLQSPKLSPRDAQALFAVEADKAAQEMQSITKELKMLKRKKKRSKVEAAQLDSGSTDLSRELSSLSRDSGAVDLCTSVTERSSSSRHRLDDGDTFSLLSPSSSLASFSGSSTLVT